MAKLEEDVVRARPHRIQRAGVDRAFAEEVLHLCGNRRRRSGRRCVRHPRQLRYSRAAFGVVVAALVRRSRGESITLGEYFRPDRSRVGGELPGTGRKHRLERAGIAQTVAEEIESAELRRGFTMTQRQADE